MEKISAAATRSVRCRTISEGDVEGVIDLLTLGFRAQRRRSFWSAMIGKLLQRPEMEGLPRLGYMLESGGRPVGVLLLIFTEVPNADVRTVRCNVSSWYVEPEFRSFAPLLVKCAIKHKDVTYVNVTPAPHTWPILTAQGYKRFSNGLFLAVPFLGAPAAADARVVSASAAEAQDETLPDRELLLDHAGYGCISVWCIAGGKAHPFVFRPRLMRRFVPCAQLVYCADFADIAPFARPLGRYLVRYGLPFIALDANDRIPGLAGVYLNDVKPKYYKGPVAPRLGDLAYTETAMFGV